MYEIFDALFTDRVVGLCPKGNGFGHRCSRSVDRRMASIDDPSHSALALVNDAEPDVAQFASLASLLSSTNPDGSSE